MGTQDDKIQTLFSRLEKAFSEIENLKVQHGRYESIVRSEAGTTERNRIDLDGKINKLEKEIKEIIFDRDKGLAFLIDRVIEREKKRDKMNGIIWGTAISLVGKIVFDIFSSLNKK